MDITRFKNSKDIRDRVEDPYVITNMDRSLEQFDTGKVDLFYASQYYLSASQYDYMYVYGLEFGRNDGESYVGCDINHKDIEKLYDGNGNLVTNNLVRCILAF